MANPRLPTSGAARTLSSRQFPKRVRLLLESILEYASDELERGLTRTLNEFEQQIFKFAEQSRSTSVQTRWLDALRVVKRNRPDLVPRFLIQLEQSLADLAEPRRETRTRPSQAPGSRTGELSLVDEAEMDESTVINEIASRIEMRNSLSIYLLGQRFGVLAAQPAFDADTLPVGPQVLMKMLREASVCLDLAGEHRLLLFRVFERQVLAAYSRFVETINSDLAKVGILPNLTYVPFRGRGSAQTLATDAAKKDVGRSTAARDGAAESLKDQLRPMLTPGLDEGALTGGPINTTTQSLTPAQTFHQVRQLLSGRRQLLSKLAGSGQAGNENNVAISAQAVQSTLSELQSAPSPTAMIGGKPQLRTITQLRQDLLVRLAKQTSDNQSPTLTEEDNDTFELVGMLYDHIMKEVKPTSPAASLLTKLQVPLMRVALEDKGFFSEEQHPARQMLNAVAETGAYWLADDDADDALMEKMSTLVDRTTREFDGNLDLFKALLSDLGAHLQTVARKAEVAERRHVEAARGKEKLAMARKNASLVVDALTRQQNISRFTQTLLSQVWTDVIALTSLRHGEDSELWRQQINTAERLIQLAKPGGSKDADPEGLFDDVTGALMQVGYHFDEASAIAHRLIDPEGVSKDKSGSRTELTMKLKARTRLGEDVAEHVQPTRQLSDEEKQKQELIRTLPFGTWFEFVTNQTADRVRRRMSWYSTVTGTVLFVNHRGQKVAEETFEHLAQLMVRKEAFVVQEQRTSMIERAWQAVIGALRSFAGGSPTTPGTSS